MGKEREDTPLCGADTAGCTGLNICAPLHPSNSYAETTILK